MPEFDYDATIQGLLERSRQTGKAAQGNLERGLKVRALQRPSGVRELLLWRDNDEIPSARTTDKIYQAAGFIAGIAQQKEIDGHYGLYAKDRFDWRHLCQHDWLPEEVGNERGAEVAASECTVCGSRYEVTSKTTPKKGLQVVMKYNGFKVTPATFQAVKVRGPFPYDLPSHERANLITKLSGLKAATTVQQRQQHQPVQAPEDVPPWEDMPAASDVLPHPGAEVAAELPAPGPQPRPVPELRGECCGMCGRGVLQWDGMIECQLGWEAHDPPMSGSVKEWDERKQKTVHKTVPAIAPHGELAAPLLAPQTKCMCWGGSRWIPNKEMAIRMREARAASHSDQ